MSKHLFLTPAGAALIAVCFFLPWIKISCMGTASYSGFDCGGVYWVLFIAGIEMFAAYFLLRRLKRINLLPTIVSASSVVSAAVIIYGVLTMASGKRILLIRVGPDDVNLRLQIGAYGTLLGYSMAWAGIAPMIRRRQRPPRIVPEPTDLTVEKSGPDSELNHTSA